MKTYLQSIDHYQVIEKLGRGGMADVYLALDTRNGRRVALKLVEHGTDQDARDTLAAERFGAQLQAHLCTIDPRVPRIHAFGDMDDHFYIDMEYVEGRDLSDLIRERPLETRDAVRIAVELCSLLAKSHSCCLEIEGKEFRAIIHGDIKPRNIRLDRQDNVRVLDFGIAKGLSLSRKLTSNYFGSASYSSPERLDSGRIDETSDLWSAGVVLYEMVASRLPFEAASTERLERIVQARTPPRALPDTCPKELQEIIFKALARSPHRRYQTAQEFESDLRAFLAGQSTLAAQENEETRRSCSSESPDDDDATTAQLAMPVPEIPKSSGARPEVIGILRKVFMVGLPLLLMGAALWEGVVFRSAIGLRPAFSAQQIDGEKGWEQYEGIRNRSLIGLAPLTLSAPLKKLLIADCERVVDEYRNSDVPRTRERDWQRCKRYMMWARQLDSEDSRAAALLEYADGHLLRIGTKDAEAVAAFKRAVAHAPQWPDPYLGMARSYIYGLHDSDRGTEALRRAKELGHRPGKRELAQRADAYKDRGILSWKGAAKLRDTPQEEELLSKAKEDLEEALRLYSEIAPWGQTTTQIKAVQEILAKIEARSEEISPRGSIFSWKWWRQ